MRTNEIVATIPNGASATARPDTALEIAVELPADEPNGQPDGRPAEQPSIAFRRLTWGSGLGWCRQQTLTLTPAEAEAVLKALQKSRRKWRGASATPHGKVIPFPGSPSV